MHSPSDEELMGLVRKKDRSALETLYDRYVRLVYSFALKSVGDEQVAREIVQAVFVRLWTTEAGYRPEAGKFVNWLLTVARNALIDYHRRSRQAERSVSLELTGEAAELSTTDYLPEHAMERDAVRGQIRRACTHLTPRQAQLIELVYWKGYTLREAAEQTGEPLGTVKNRLHQALKILRMHLSSREEGLS